MENFKITCPRCGQKSEMHRQTQPGPAITDLPWGWRCSVCDCGISTEEVMWHRIQFLVEEIDTLKRQVRVLGGER